MEVKIFVHCGYTILTEMLKKVRLGSIVLYTVLYVRKYILSVDKAPSGQILNRVD